MEQGAIILCGGKSSRMGRDKATLPFGPECMLQRVVRLIATVVDVSKIVVVASPDQVLPELPDGLQIARDDRRSRGPLEGLAAGMRTLKGRAHTAYATGCDVPLLAPKFVERLFEMLGDYDIVVPRDSQYLHPLAAVYRLNVLDHVQRLLNADRLRPRLLFDEAKTLEIPVDELRSVDPQLLTLENLNHPEDYQRALTIAGIEPQP